MSRDLLQWACGSGGVQVIGAKGRMTAIGCAHIKAWVCVTENCIQQEWSQTMRFEMSF